MAGGRLTSLPLCQEKVNAYKGDTRHNIEISKEYNDKIIGETDSYSSIYDSSNFAKLFAVILKSQLLHFISQKGFLCW
jgi:hypothetical protein